MRVLYYALVAFLACTVCLWFDLWSYQPNRFELPNGVPVDGSWALALGCDFMIVVVIVAFGAWIDPYEKKEPFRFRKRDW